ncbi:MAG: hypothetical protein QOJ46_2025 [bacterium]|jgi:hypothetical protein
MSRSLKGAATAVVACATVLATAGAASAGTVAGTVVHRNTHARSFVVAAAGGKLSAVHARRSPTVGRVVRVTTRRLANGTFAASRVRTRGRRTRARLRGTVSHVDRRSFVVSARGASIRVRRAASTTGATPDVGKVITVDARLDHNGDLDADDVDELGEDIDGIEIEGLVLAVDPVARTITVSADDDDESGQSLLVHVPATIDIAAFTVGQVVELSVTQTADGFVLQGSSSDENADEADNPENQQGEDGPHGDRGPSGNQGPSAEGNRGPSGENNSGPSGGDERGSSGDSGPNG